MRRLVLFYILSLVVPNYFFAQSSSEILSQLKKLEKTGSVLYIAAHPDDENTRLLAYLANERMMRTGYLSLTRGDGGQNLIGTEQGVPLGLIRTNELMAARGIDKAEQFFSRAYDFGYSKNPEETFTFWNHDSILADVVWVIRNFKPDILICRFPTTGEGGHGHHTASAMLAEEAFEAAANPTMFPEQLKWCNVWQAKRILWNTFNFGGNNTTSDDQLKVDVGAYNVLLGRSYGEIASESRSQHKSQGFGSAKQRGENLEYFKHIKGEPATSDLFDGIDVNWTRIAAAKGLGAEIRKVIFEFDATQLEASIPLLKRLLQKICALPEDGGTISYWKKIKTAEVENLIVACAGLYVEVNPNEYSVCRNEMINSTLSIIARNKVSTVIQGIHFWDSDSIFSRELESNKLYQFKHIGAVPADINYSNPYWLNRPNSLGQFDVEDPSLIGQPVNKPALTCTIDLEVEGVPLQRTLPLVYKFTDPVRGEVYRPLEILPVATFDLKQTSLVTLPGKTSDIELTVHANSNNVVGKLNWSSDNNWKVNCISPEVNLMNKGDEVVIKLTVTAPTEQSFGVLQPTIELNNEDLNLTLRRIDYDHIPSQFILSPAEIKLVAVDVKNTSKNVGYIEGAGDGVPQALEQMGCKVTFLQEAQIMGGDLSAFDAIVTGVRAYNVNDRMAVYYPYLMKYVQEGGNLIVQYNTNNRIGPLKSKMGPYDFTISRNRVTDENAEVTFLLRDHPAYKTPNVISAADFEGWIQERGIYFATEVDERYTKLFGMADKGEEMLTTSTIVANFGKGNFVYTGLAFFRELPAGVPGAFRLFANLISLPKDDE